LGIGTTNPGTSKLSVLGTVGISESGNSTNVGGRTQLSSSGSGFVLNHNDNSPIIFQTLGAERYRWDHTAAALFIGRTSSTGTSSQALQVGSATTALGAYVSGSVGIGTTNPSYKLHVVGSFGATTKSFVVPHPTKPGKTLQYGSLESPYHGIRLTGKGTIENGKCVVKLPDYISAFVKEDGVNIHITNIKHGEVLWVEEIDVANNNFTIQTKRTRGTYEFYWDFTAIRKDVADLEVEI
jgi:hypothetical protein